MVSGVLYLEIFDNLKKGEISRVTMATGAAAITAAIETTQQNRFYCKK